MENQTQLLSIESLTIRGFMGVRPGVDDGLTLNDMKSMNVLIGPNNAGKSLPIRFLRFLRDRFLVRQEFGGQDTTEEFGARLFWEESEPCEIFAELRFRTNRESHVTPGTQYQMIEGGVLRTEFKATNYQGQVSYYFVPMTLVNGTQMPVCRISRGRSDEWLRNGGDYGPGDHEFANHCRRLFADLASRMYIFDAIRALDRGGEHREVDDGSRLLNSLNELSKTAARVTAP
jgi:hypothetical protein